MHNGVANVCVPSRASNYLLAVRKPLHETAVLIVGEKPGVDEDRACATMVGVTGNYVEKIYIQYRELNGAADVYLANAVKCRVPGNGDPTSAQLTACRKHLLADIAVLKAAYTKVVILATGSPACKTITGLSLDKFWRYQGSEHLGCPVFATFNSAILLPGRDPSKITAIEDHLNMLHDYLEKGVVPCDVEMPTVERAAIPDGPVSILSLDIETYGAVDGLPRQTVFHPRKATSLDGVSPADVIQTVGLGWRVADGALRTSVYMWPEDRGSLREALSRALGSRSLLLGMNLPFDLMFLRAFTDLPLTKRDIPRLADLSIANFLNSDVRPEKSLKEISPLLRVADYSDELSLKDGERYPSRFDENLWRYNCLDTIATLVSWERLRESSSRLYPGTAKFSESCLAWYSDLLWTVIEMSEAGVAFDAAALDRIERKQERRLNRYRDIIHSRYDGVLAGTGSRKYLKQLVCDAVAAAGLIGDDRVSRTKKTDEISTEKDNIHLLLGVLPINNPLRTQLRFLEAYRGSERLVGTYTRPLLGRSEKRRGSSLIDGIAYPTWYPVPSKSDDSQSGGTKQGRLSAKGPAIQTLPRVIEKAIASRWPGGSILTCDYQQAELRVAAFLSGDSEMLAEYDLPDADLHRRTTRLLFGEDYGKRPDAKKIRKIGKTLNFLTLYGGGAAKFQETVRRMHGLELSLQECERLLYDFRSKYPQLRTWQEQLVQKTVSDGYQELPITGQSRTYLGHPKAVLKSYSAEIMNQPVQTTAANCMLSAQRAISDQLQDAGLRSLVIYNGHDAVKVDCYPGEEDAVRAIVSRATTCPEYKSRLESLTGRRLNLAVDIEITRRAA